MAAMTITVTKTTHVFITIMAKIAIIAIIDLMIIKTTLSIKEYNCHKRQKSSTDVKKQ